MICGYPGGDVSDGLRRCVKALAGKDLADQRQIEPPGHRDAFPRSDFGNEQECFSNQRMRWLGAEVVGMLPKRGEEVMAGLQGVHPQFRSSEVCRLSGQCDVGDEEAHLSGVDGRGCGLGVDEEVRRMVLPDFPIRYCRFHPGGYAALGLTRLFVAHEERSHRALWPTTRPVDCPECLQDGADAGFLVSRPSAPDLLADDRSGKGVGPLGSSPVFCPVVSVHGVEMSRQDQ